LHPENSLQTSKTNDSPTSEQDEEMPIATMSVDVSPVGEDGVQKKSQEIQEKDDRSQLSSGTKHLKRSKELERGKSEKMRADIQALTNTLDNFKNLHEVENWRLQTSLSDLGNDISAIMSMLRLTPERQDSQEKLMHERELTQEQRLYDCVSTLKQYMISLTTD
jgi:hypothetical protein